MTLCMILLVNLHNHVNGSDFFAGAIISGGKGTAAEKIAAMEKAGIKVAKSPADIGETLVAALGAKV